jgi:hypothetical protein
MQQTWIVRWLDSIGMAAATFWRHPIICWILRPFHRVQSTIARVVARSRFQGWRMGLLLNCCISAIILCINVVVLIFMYSRKKGLRDGFAEPFDGTAEIMSLYSSAIHIAINALSTVLLAASNYTMQVLSSPTRKDIDRAHSRKEYLDIGFLSRRNLGRISKRRLILFLLMGLSTIPMHLL